MDTALYLCRAANSKTRRRVQPCWKPTDSQRIARALEVVRSTGKPLSRLAGKKESGGIESDKIELHPMLILLPDRDWLYERCDRRFVQMLENGAIEEVEALAERGQFGS